MPHPLETYLTSLAYLHGIGVVETSGYPVLETLLNEVGATLKPKVRCVIHPKSAGAGIPDGGMFTADQLVKHADPEMFGGPIPERGAIEVKGAKEEVDRVADGVQVAKYLAKYRQVLVTNYRDFLLVEGDGVGPIRVLDEYHIATDEPGFWLLAAHARDTDQKQGGLFVDFIKRVMLKQAQLAEPSAVAWLLASYAREALARVEDPSELPALESVREALSSALGLAFTGEKGEHFFRSTLVQTLFYGLFSAWVLWKKEGNTGEFNWQTAQWQLRVPVLRALFERIASPGSVVPLKLGQTLDAAADALNRVDAEIFFQRFQQEHAVQYFYEPFLAAFDPELRKQLGVWYTPPEIVKYQVARVDAVLKEELGIADGLADERVVVLDPCCGTGAYLVETLRRIAETVRHNQGEVQMAHAVKKAARERVFGFEILPAPFVVSHLQLGLLLQSLGAPLAGNDERAGVYLTNALTGWEPPTGEKQHLPFAELEQERDAAAEVKREKPILVILGNPPYNAYAGVSPAEEHGLVAPYKEGLVKEWGIKKFNLDDLYVRFFRLAERRIAETSGRGVVCFISNSSWLSGPSFVVMRQHLLASFDRFWIDNMHGDRKISEYAPDGRTSETVFAIAGMSVGIQQGTAISLWVKSGSTGEPRVLHNDGLTAAKAGDRRADLVATLDALDFDAQYAASAPTAENRYSFRPGDGTVAYMAWPRLIDLHGGAIYPGLAEDRRKALLSPEPDSLAIRMQEYLDGSVSWDDHVSRGGALAHTYVDFPAISVRLRALQTESFTQPSIRRYFLRPFDTQYCYYTTFRPIWRRPRPEFFSQVREGNSFLTSRLKASSDREGVPVGFITGLCDYHYLTPNACAIPMWVTRQPDHDTIQAELIPTEAVITANLSRLARAYLAALGFPDPDTDEDTGSLLWMHALAIGYSPLYLAENADGIRQDWPRVPLPGWPTPLGDVVGIAAALRASAELGRRVAALLDTETPVPGVTTTTVRDDLRGIAVLKVTAGPADFRVTAGWGHKGQGGVTMPGRGRVSEPNPPAPFPTSALRAGGRGSQMEETVTGVRAVNDPANGPSADRPLGEGSGVSPDSCLLSPSLDIYLNGSTYWSNVPIRVWEYTIGGYQVMKKWLSYRELGILGRPITPEEAQEVTNMARRIAALVGMEDELDTNYRAISAP